jgi:hypothetical protein
MIGLTVKAFILILIELNMKVIGKMMIINKTKKFIILLMDHGKVIIKMIKETVKVYIIVAMAY